MYTIQIQIVLSHYKLHSAEVKLQCASEKTRWMWMQKNTRVPRLNKGISCQEKGDKNCNLEQGGQA